MARPLRAVYANTTYSTGVREMSDSELNDLVAPLILSYVTTNPSVAYGTSLRIDTAGLYDVSRGSVVDTRSAAVGAHPASNSTINTYTLYQSERSLSMNLSARPVKYVQNSSEWQIKPMTDQDILDYVIPSIVQTMISGGQGAYYLGPTSAGAPVGGTWTSYGTINDTYYVNSTLTTDQYTLWQRTTGTTAGTVRPLKINSVGNLVEMDNTDITLLYQAVGEYIRTVGVGQYAIQPTAPSTGTWAQRGYFTNTVNNLQDTAYNGTYVGSFTSPYTRAFTGAFNNAFTGAYVGTYSKLFTGTFTGAYLGTYSSSFTGAFTGIYTSVYTGIYTGTFSGVYVGSFTGAFTGVYAGSYTGTYASNYAGGYQNPYNAVYYTGFYAGSRERAYVGNYAGSYASAFSRGFTGLYNGSFTGIYARGYAGAYNSSFTGAFTGSYSGGYSSSFTGAFTGSYSGAYTGTFSGIYTGAFTGLYNTSFTGAYTGLTVLNTTSSTTYKLWVRTA